MVWWYSTAGTRKHSILGCFHRQNIDNMRSRAPNILYQTGRGSSMRNTMSYSSPAWALGGASLPQPNTENHRMSQISWALGGASLPQPNTENRDYPDILECIFRERWEARVYRSQTQKTGFTRHSRMQISWALGGASLPQPNTENQNCVPKLKHAHQTDKTAYLNSKQQTKPPKLRTKHPKMRI